MDLRLLRYFLVVAEERHITRAAARLGIQQAPLSQQIKKLEQDLGAQLFRRKPRGVELTEAGTTLKAEALSVLAHMDNAIATTKRVARGEQGEIRIGLTTSACFHPFPPLVIRKFQRERPQVSLQFEQSSTASLLNLLQQGRVDIAFVRTVIVQPEGVDIVPLLVEPMVVALPAHHPLAKGTVPRRIVLKSLAAEHFIGYPRVAGVGLYDSVIAACVANGFNPNIAHEAPQIVSTLNLVASGMGVSVVPESMRRLQIEGVVYCDISGPNRPRGRLDLAVRRDSGSASATFTQIARSAKR